MAANTIEDLLVNVLKNTSQWTQTLVAKVSGKYLQQYRNNIVKERPPWPSG